MSMLPNDSEVQQQIFGAKNLMNNHSLPRYVLLTAAYCMQHVPRKVLLLLSLLLKMALGCAAHFSVLSRMTKAGVLSIACVVIRYTAKMFAVTSSGINMLDLENQISHVHVVDKERDALHPHHIRPRGTDVIFSDPINRKIYQYTPESEKTEIITGNGDENCIDGPVSQCSYR